MDIRKIRKVIPRWPSELDVAKCATNWASMAQQFFCAALVLSDEMDKALGEMHSNREVTDDILQRHNTSIAALYCLAFSLELAAKAAYVRVRTSEGIEDKNNLPFLGHNILSLCDDKLPEIHFSESERVCLKQAEEIITNLKYPSGQRPKGDKSFSTPPNFENFAPVAIPIYQKLIDIATCEQSADPGKAMQ